MDIQMQIDGAVPPEIKEKMEAMGANVNEILQTGVLEQRLVNLRQGLENAGRDLLAANIMWLDGRLKSDPLRAVIKRYVDINNRYQEVLKEQRLSQIQKAQENLPEGVQIQLDTPEVQGALHQTAQEGSTTDGTQQ